VHVQYSPWGTPVALSRTTCSGLMSSLSVLCDGRQRALMIKKDETLQNWTAWINCFNFYGRDSLYVCSDAALNTSVCFRNRFTSASSMFGNALRSDDQSVNEYRNLGVRACRSRNWVAQGVARSGQGIKCRMLRITNSTDVKTVTYGIDFGNEVLVLRSRHRALRSAADNRFISL